MAPTPTLESQIKAIRLESEKKMRQINFDSEQKRILLEKKHKDALRQLEFDTEELLKKSYIRSGQWNWIFDEDGRRLLVNINLPNFHVQIISFPFHRDGKMQSKLSINSRWICQKQCQICFDENIKIDPINMYSQFTPNSFSHY